MVECRSDTDASLCARHLPESGVYAWVSCSQGWSSVVPTCVCPNDHSIVMRVFFAHAKKFC
jgi:hypothetical protein